MNEKMFWHIIGQLDWKAGEDALVMKPCIDELIQMPIEEIYRFEDILTEKLFALDTRAIAREIGESSLVENEYFSPDYFLYVRCVIVANGKTLFDKVLKHPEDCPKDLEFEALLSIAREAFEQKTDKDWDYFCDEFSYETGSNEDGWK